MRSFIDCDISQWYFAAPRSCFAGYRNLLEVLAVMVVVAS